jgi:hypothetical protein
MTVGDPGAWCFRTNFHKYLTDECCRANTPVKSGGIVIVIPGTDLMLRLEDRFVVGISGLHFD